MDDYQHQPGNSLIPIAPGKHEPWREQVISINMLSLYSNVVTANVFPGNCYSDLFCCFSVFVINNIFQCLSCSEDKVSDNRTIQALIIHPHRS